MSGVTKTSLKKARAGAGKGTATAGKAGVSSKAARRVELLFEIGAEEIPAGMLPRAVGELKTILEKHLAAESLQEGVTVETFGGPRRLTAWVRGLIAKQADVENEVTGPPKSVAYDNVGAPTRAAMSFAEKQGVALQQLFVVQAPKGEYLAAKVVKRGRTAHELLSEILPRVIHDLSWPRTMTWTGLEGARFIRPVRWLVGVLDGKPLKFSFGGITAGDVTAGHRFLGKPEIRVRDFADYEKKLRANGVIVRPAQRLKRIQNELASHAKRGGYKVHEDAGLLQLVSYLNEFPTVIQGDFDPSFLELPDEILITVMRDHQKYFAVEQVGPSGARPGVAVEHAGLTGARPSSDSPDGQDQLAPHFVAVLNMDSDEKGLIRQGHERVLAARFTDAEFFWSADQHLSLRERFDKGMLEQVTYHARLGTYGDKVRRMQDLANYLLSALEMTPQQGEHVRQAVELCKCDLTTQMVQEFTELQGIVGGLYAREQGEPLEVADAIYDHYLPQGAGDRCPRSLVGAVVSLADKFDSVAAGFQAGLEPTGSSDPFALRRAGNGIVKLAVEVLPGLDLTNLANQTFHAQPASAGVQSVPIGTGLGRKVDDFLRERLEFYFRETAGLRYDAVRAVLRPTKIFPDLVPSAALSRARALERVRDSEDFMALATAAKRTRNIRKSADAADIVEGQADPALFVEEPERELYAAYQSLGRRIAELSGSADFEEAFRLMATIRPHVDRFFDKVLVMTEDATLRRNRLKLLLRLNEDAFTSLADLAEIVVESR